MGIWPFGKEKAKAEPEEKVFFEDLPPRFHTQDLVSDKLKEKQEQQQQQQQQQGNTIVQKAIDSISLEDFKFGNLVKMPCFREAGLIGISSMSVLSITIFLMHKNVSRATNWGIGGGLLGSLVGWEQCRSQKRRSINNVEIAKEKYQKKVAQPTEKGAKE